MIRSLFKTKGRGSRPAPHRPDDVVLGDQVRPSISVVICSIDDTKLRKVRNNYRNLLDSFDVEIIEIRDAKSLAEGYNRGIARASGQILILSHDDIDILTPDFGSRLVSHLDKYDLVGIAGTKRLVGGAWFLAGSPYDYQLVTSPIEPAGTYVIVLRGPGDLIQASIQAVDGVFMAMRREVASNIQFDAKTFDHFHLYDIDFSFRAYLAGYKLAICRDLFIVHDSHGNFDATWEMYRRRFEEKFANLLPAHPTKVESPVLRVQIDGAMLKGEKTVRWLCDSKTITGLLAKLPAPARNPESSDYSQEK